MSVRRNSASGEWDYIVVGGGAAGCILAGRLAQDGGNRVLLLEAGGRYPHAALSVPLASMRQTQAYSWKYFSRQQAGLGFRRISLPFGKVLGGSSSTNAMMYLRGSRRAYDRWRDFGNLGWGFQDVLPYFRRSENFHSGESAYHGVGGPLDVSELRFRSPFSLAFVEACLEIGLPLSTDFNGAGQEGAGFYHVTQRRGRRTSTAYFLRRRSRQALEVRTRATVQRIVLEGMRAVGVEFEDQNGSRAVAYAAREVALCAGAFNTPQILMLSGIGPAELVSDTGIQTQVDLPGVGRGLQDHVRVPVLYESGQRSPGDMRNWVAAAADYALRRRGVLTSNCCESGALVRTDETEKMADLQFVTHFQSSIYPGTVDLQFCLLSSPSRGRVTISSADARVPPAIDPNYLSDPADIRRALVGIRLARKIASAPSLRHFPLGKEVLPGADLSSDRDLELYIRSTADTCYHPAGSCRMGNDPMAVVDPQLCVRGVQGLRIADASVMPELPNGNTCASTAMIAEKAADLMKGTTIPSTLNESSALRAR